MDNQSVPKLDLSFSCDSVRSARKPELGGGTVKKDGHDSSNVSSALQSNRTQLQPPYAVDLNSDRPLTASSYRKPQYNAQQMAGLFTPYNENRTARQLLEREFTNLNIGRKFVENRLPEEDVVKSSKDVATARPFATSRSDSLAPGEPAKRIAFGARLLVNSDGDSLREFNGFFWPDDSTLAVYEFRGLNKATARAPPRVLPFVTRKKYKHAGGIRQGQPVTVCDITEGRDIVLSVSDNAPALNDALRQRSIFVIRVTNVDIAEKRSVILKDVRISEHDEVLAKLHAPQTNEEAEARALLFNIRSVVKKCLRNRGIPSLLNMRHELGISVKLPSEKQLDENAYKKYSISREQMTTLLNRFGIKLDSAAVDRLYSLLDADQNGFVDFGEFVRGIIGGMSETRHLFARRAWAKMDPSKTGRLSISTLRKFYSARTHPDVISGERTEHQIISAFASMLQPPTRSQRFSAKGDDGEALVGFGEFETYYEGLSLAIDSDEDFLRILKDTWGNLSN